MLGIGQLPDDELHAAVTAGDDYACSRGDQLFKIHLGVERYDQVVREQSAQPGFELGRHVPSAGAEDEQASRRAFGRLLGTGAGSRFHPHMVEEPGPCRPGSPTSSTHRLGRIPDRRNMLHGWSSTATSTA